MKKIVLLMVVFMFSVSVTNAENINFVTAGTQSTFYGISVGIVKLWNEKIEGIKAVATPSGGGVDNLNQAREGQAQIGIANVNLVYHSMNGTDMFDGFADENVRIFAGLYYNPNQIVVTKKSGIKTVSDIKGKHFSIGAAGSTNIDEAIHHLAVYGITIDDFTAEYMDVSSSADAIQNKQLDGAWIMAGIPNSAITQILTSTDSTIIPIPEEMVEELKKDYPWYASVVIPSEAYDGLDEDVPTSAVKLTLFITNDVSDELAYEMVKVFWENWDELTEMFPALSAADPHKACSDLAGIPLHDGVARYYREIGLIE